MLKDNKFKLKEITMKKYLILGMLLISVNCWAGGPPSAPSKQVPSLDTNCNQAKYFTLGVLCQDTEHPNRSASFFMFADLGNAMPLNHCHTVPRGIFNSSLMKDAEYPISSAFAFNLSLKFSLISICYKHLKYLIKSIDIIVLYSNITNI